MGWKAQSFVSRPEQPLPGTRLGAATPNFLPATATAWLFHLQFLLFRWVEITPINIDGLVYRNGYAEFWWVVGQAHVNCSGIRDWEPKVLCRQGGSRVGGLYPCRVGEVMREPSLGLPSWYSTLWKLGTASVFFPGETRKSEKHCTGISLAPPGLIFPSTATPWHGDFCWSRGFAYSEETETRIPYPVTSSPSSACWEMGEFQSMTPENITKMILANSINLQKPFQMKCPEIKTLKQLKVFRMLINSDDLYVLIFIDTVLFFKQKSNFLKCRCLFYLKQRNGV